MSELTNRISDLDFYELHRVFLDSDFYQILFPFLITYCLFYTVLGKIKFFQYKKSKNFAQPIKPVIVILSLVISFYSVTFKINDNATLGELLMMMFPNISALTIGILSLYVVGSILGKNFFKGVFRKDHSAYLFMAVGVIGLGSVIYYVGIAMGFWDNYPINQSFYWNFIFGIALLILGIVFLLIDLIPIGFLFLTIFGIYVYNYGEDIFILEYFIDPVVFIVFIVIVLMSWLNSGDEKKAILKKNIQTGQMSLENFRDEYGGKPKDFDSKIYDIMDEALKSNKKKLKKL